MINAVWRKVIEAEPLQRSSHSLAVVGTNAYVFGGELRPREPRDNDVYVFGLDKQDSSEVTKATVTSTSPSPRVGTLSTSLNSRIYIFSGRGGTAMAPIEENGSIWEYNPLISTWTRLQPADLPQPHPEARSYHALTNDGVDTLYLHAGCPESGRLSDLWSFSTSTRQWKELTPAPSPGRGGPSIAFSNGLLYRMNGFDGKSEIGGALDIYDPGTNTWSTHSFLADGNAGPGARSVGALLPLTINHRPSLITLFGESDPSSLGHQGAGKMLGDVWVFDVESQGWSEVGTVVDGAAGGDLKGPDARGWSAADVVGGGGGLVVQGGLGEGNERLGDAWMLSFG